MLDTIDQSIAANRFDQGRGLMANMSGDSLGRLVSVLVDPEHIHTSAEKQLADYVMREISSGTRTANNPHYKHKEGAKPSVKKDHEHSGTQPSKYKKKREKFPSALRTRGVRGETDYM